ncbi:MULTISPECIES: type II toxin-antitoxin system RelB/DinJ family antitoxin [unclassified Candidatus Tisiphia]|uniref:type II toxin-antitoxin system RelB/DinJ family antitoxin n=1 Tax=unclassified Candidatus Tisiphia TaxID=2996318 RepID=UPI00312CA20A
MDNVDIRLRISSEIKDEAELVFHEMGMTLSEAIRIFIKQSINSRGLPFRPHVKKPNLETLQAFKESEEGDYTKSSLTEFKQSLNID